MIHFTSDSHYGHSNIAGPSVSNWESGYRNFSSIFEMNDELVRAFNEQVGPDDTVYHLGDWSFGGIENIWNFRKQLNCNNIHLILGNHDLHIQRNKVLPNVHRDAKGRLVDGPPRGLDDEVQAQELFASVSHYKEVFVEKVRIILCHYAFRVWNKSHHGSWNLHGHSHDSLPYMSTAGVPITTYPVDSPLSLQMDVGVDSAYRLYGDYRPISFEEISELMQVREGTRVDHHNRNTN